MNAVVVLTRGYTDIIKYDELIKRNNALLKNYSNSLDYVIMHEGNIPKEHQLHIQNKTPDLPLTFIDVGASFRTESLKEIYTPTKRFPLGYRNMCNFWFCEFWKYLEKYDKILRIDEDCMMYSDYRHIFEELDEHIVCVYGNWAGDCPNVTRGLNNFIINFLKTHDIKASSKSPSGPSTCVMGFNIKELKKNEVLKNLTQSKELTDNVFIYRWGDAPLWGDVLHYLFNGKHKTCNLHYYHGSHKRLINTQK